MKPAFSTLILALVLSAAPALATPNEILRQGSADEARRDLALLESQGWVSFGERGGRRYVDFSPMLEIGCAVAHMRVSFNSHSLDGDFDNPSCTRENEDEDLVRFVTLAIESPDEVINYVAVQAVFSDGTASAIMTYAPCPKPPAAGGRCAVVVDGPQ